MNSSNPFVYMFKNEDGTHTVMAGAVMLLATGAMFGVVVAFIWLAPAFLDSPSLVYDLRDRGAIPWPPLGGPLGVPVEIAFWLVLGSIFGGYSIRIVRNIITGSTVLLPDMFDDLAGTIWRGFLINIIFYCWLLPTAGCGVLAYYLGWDFVASGAVVLIAVGGIWGVFVLFVFPAIAGRYAETGRLSSGFELGHAISAVRLNFRTYLLAVLLEFLAALVGALGFYPIPLPIGFLVTIPYALLVIAGIWGFAYRSSLGHKRLDLA